MSLSPYQEYMIKVIKDQMLSDYEEAIRHLTYGKEQHLPRQVIELLRNIKLKRHEIKKIQEGRVK